jgi:hypothetical protein
MSREFNLQPPQAYARLCETLSARGGAPAVAPAVGEVARVLAASRPGGVFLCLGRGAGEMAAWILDGMDLSGRLVVVVQDSDEAEVLRPILGNDLRITVHAQEAAAFLGDVRDHRFDLITDLSSGQPADLTRLALGRLALGAFYVSLHGAPELSFAFAHLSGELGISLIVRGPQRVQAKRRGGRRARQGVTPLFSSRTPRRR